MKQNRLMFPALKAGFVFLMAFALTLSACAPAATPTALPPTEQPKPTEAPTAIPAIEPAAPQTITLTDGWGREVTLAGPAQRIISLAPSTTELLFAVGAGSQIIGRDMQSDYPAEVANITDIGSTYQELNTELIVSLKPDLVVGGDLTAPDQVKALEDLGITVYIFGNPVDFDEMYTKIESAGIITGHTEQTAQLVDSLKARVAAVLETVSKATTKPTVFYEIDSTDPTKPWTTGPRTFMDTMITLAGGQNIGATLEGAFVQINQEALVVQDPDIILLGDTAYGVTVESVGQRPGWDDLSAVKNGMVFGIDDDLTTRPGPRMVDGLELMARTLHPELFK